MPLEAQPLFLVSGGASSLVEVLAPGVDLAELRALNVGGLASGHLDIAEFNARRQQISRYEGRALRGAARGRPALALFHLGRARPMPRLADRLGVARHLPAPSRRTIGSSASLLASIDAALEAVRRRDPGTCTARAGGRFDDDAAVLGVRFASRAELAGPPGLGARGGESIVHLPARPGRGGRSQHLALVPRSMLAGSRDALLLAVGTDGSDGPTSDAGALVDGATVTRVQAAGLDAHESLARADSAAALAAAGDLVHTGPTGTNVGDLVLTLKLSESEAQSWLADPCACS